MLEIDFSEQNFENVFDSKELNILIKNLSSLKLLENIKIKIRNKKLKIPNDINKIFLNMDIKKEEDVSYYLGNIFKNNFFNLL